MSGSVNLSRKQPVFKTMFQAKGAYGPYTEPAWERGCGLGGPGTGRGVAIQWFASGFGQLSRRQEQRYMGTEPCRDTAKRKDNGNGEFRIRDQRIQVGFGAAAGGRRVGPAYRGPVPTSLRSMSPIRRYSASVWICGTRLSPGVTLRNKLYYTDFSWISNGTLFSGVYPNAEGSLDLFRTLLLLDDRQKVLGNQFELVFSFATGPARHTLLAGLELMRWQDRFTLDVAVLPNLDLYEPVETAALPFLRRAGPVPRGGRDQRCHCAFCRGSNCVFGIVPGVRWRALRSHTVRRPGHVYVKRVSRIESHGGCGDESRGRYDPLRKRGQGICAAVQSRRGTEGRRIIHAVRGGREEIPCRQPPSRVAGCLRSAEVLHWHSGRNRRDETGRRPALTGSGTGNDGASRWRLPRIPDLRVFQRGTDALHGNGGRSDGHGGAVPSPGPVREQTGLLASPHF